MSPWWGGGGSGVLRPTRLRRTDPSPPHKRPVSRQRYPHQLPSQALTYVAGYVAAKCYDAADVIRGDAGVRRAAVLVTVERLEQRAHGVLNRRPARGRARL